MALVLFSVLFSIEYTIVISPVISGQRPRSPALNTVKPYDEVNRKVIIN